MADNEDIDNLADGEPGPDKEPKSAKAWQSMITDAEKAYHDYHERADNIDKLYADLSRLANTTRDRQFQLFWANVQVLNPSVYSRPPVPVVVPRFKDRKPLIRVTSELLERSAVVTFELEDIDSVMRLIRDDMVILARGCAWLRYEAENGKDGYFSERVCIEFVDRKDFLHDPARTWKEVDWVSRASYLTKKEMRKRFKKTSGDEYQKASYEDRKEDETDDGKLKAKVWEIWSKSQNKVVWVSEGCEKLLDEGKPHLTLDGFFPCPRPAYATVQRRSLVPVPDMVFYKDQLEEINELTARIGALTDAVKVRGFYPAGAGEIGDAIEAAVKSTTDNQVLIPISNWAMIGSGGVKDMIVWLPLDMISKVITELVALRKELIDDVYQITGLSDIMRGSTEASETLGAQELKSQYGSVRIKDRQAELVRMARDITRIAGEIMAENFQPKTLLEMSQLEIDTEASLAQQAAPIQQQLQKLMTDAHQAMADPEMQQLAQQNPEKAQQVMQQAQQQAEQLQGQLAKLQQKPTVEKVMEFLRNQRIRPFVLDIETDSTIAPDENATKQRATEYVTAVGGFMGQALPLVQAIPQSAPVVADVLKFAAAQFRAGREVEGSIEEFADQMKAMAQQPKPADPATIKAQGDAQTAQADAAERTANAQKTMLEAQDKAQQAEHDRKLALAEAVDAARARSVDIQGKKDLGALQLDQTRQKHAQDMELGELNIALLETKIHQAETQTDNSIATTDAKIEQGEAQTEAKAAQASSDGASPKRPAKPKTDRPQHRPLRAAITDGHQQTAEMMAAALKSLGEQNAAIVEALRAPKMIIKDHQGSPVGVKTVQ